MLLHHEWMVPLMIARAWYLPLNGKSGEFPGLARML
jgi:hypothetical protein